MTLTKVKVEFPVHVSSVKVDGKNQYQIKPLFFDHVSIVHQRFDSALSRFQNVIQKQFKGYELNKNTIDRLNWFKFSPKIDFKIYSLSIPISSKQFFHGTYSVAIFEIKNITFACLPRMHSFMFILEKDNKGKFHIESQLTKVIQKLMVRYKDYSPEDFSYENYISSRKEFSTTVSSTIQINFTDLKFSSENLNSFFAEMTGGQKMEGATEIWKVGKNLNHHYPSGLNQAFFQEEIVERLKKIFFNTPFKNSPIAIIGEEGIGKHTIIHETLRRYLDDKSGNEKREVWQVDPTRIITGMSIVGMWQKRLEAILSFLKNPYNENRGSDVMLIDNVVAMLRIGKSASSNMSLNDVLKPHLEKRSIQLIILATQKEWKIVQEKDIRFADLFQVIRLEEPSLEESVKMTLENRKRLEEIHQTEISIKAVQAIFDFRRNFLHRKALPGSAIKLLNQLAIKHKNQKVDLEEVRSEFQSYSGLDQDVFDPTIPLEKDEIRLQIRRGLIGQPPAVQALTNVIHNMKSRLNNRKKPIGSFMFIGPTGVGKTQAAKVLTKYLTGSESNLMQFDMNEFIDYHAVQRLIGDVQNPEGILTSKVRYQPFGVILLDEIEKAHPKVHDILLQILDDARLTDSLGRTVDFSNTIIIMTSNIGAKDVSTKLGFSKQSSDNDAIYRKSVENFFRPEFVNRIDDIVIFNRLSLNHILKIAKLQINELLTRDGFVRRTTILSITNDALEWVARRGYDEQMGGRALKRQIEKDLTSLTAQQLVGSYSKSPILFEIFLKNKKLIPQVSKLEFIEQLQESWFPNLPMSEKGKGFYNHLLRILKKTERKVDRMNRKSDDYVDLSESKFYLFKLNITETTERIVNLSLAFSDKRYIQPPAIPLRLKRNDLITQRSETIHKENFKDLFFQQEGLAEINEIYNHTAPFFNSVQTEFLNSFLDVAFIQLFTKEFIKDAYQKITLRFQSCVNDAGQEQIEYLSKIFSSVLESIGIEHKVDKNHHIQMEGYNLVNLFYGEQGIHFFQIPYKNPIPIRLLLENEDKIISKIKDQKVIRVYNENTITDLRTGFSNAANITPIEFKLLLFAGIKETLRRNLVN